MATSDTIRRSGRRGFTLLEIIIVLGLIILIASIALPSISALFNAGAEAQAVALLSGQLSAARAGAVLDGRYWAVHVQMGDPDNDDLKDICFSAVMKLKFDRGLATSGSGSSLGDTSRTGTSAWETDEWDGAIVEITSGPGSGRWGWVTSNTTNSLSFNNLTPDTGSGDPDAGSAYRVYRFALADGYTPERLPGTMAFGQVTAEANNYSYVYDEGNGDDGNYKDLNDADLRTFASLTIIFSPKGQVVTKLYSLGLSEFAIPFGTAGYDPLFRGDTKVWDVPDDEHGVSAVTVFDYAKLKLLDAPGRAAYLDESGQFLPINVYSGRLFPRK